MATAYESSDSRQLLKSKTVILERRGKCNSTLGRLKSVVVTGYNLEDRQLQNNPTLLHGMLCDMKSAYKRVIAREIKRAEA